jgi:hypothetical protein
MGGQAPTQDRGALRRKAGTPNKIQSALSIIRAEVFAEAARTGRTALQVMIENMHVAHEQATPLYDRLIKALEEGALAWIRSRFGRQHTNALVGLHYPCLIEIGSVARFRQPFGRLP